MSGADNNRHQPPPSDGEFLLRLLQNHRNNHPQPPSSYNPTLDPAVSSVGPSLSPPSQNPNYFPPWPHQFSPSNRTSSSFHPAPHHHFRHLQPPQQPPQQQSNSIGNTRSNNFNFDFFNERELGFDGEGGVRNGFDSIRGNRVQLHGSNSKGGLLNDSNLDRNFDLFKERDLGFNFERSVGNGFDSNRGNDPYFNRLANPRMNLNDSNLDQNFDLLKEREMGFNHESGVRNGFDSNRGNDPRLNWVQSQRNSSSVNESNLERGFDVGSGVRNGFDSNRRIDPRMNWAQNHGSPPEVRRSGPPPGFSGSNSNQRGRGMSSTGGLRGSNGKDFEKDGWFSRRDDVVGVRGGGGLVRQLEHPGLPGGSDHVSVLGSDVEESFKVLHGGEDDNGVSQDEVDELSEQLVDSVLDEGPSGEKGELSGNKKQPRDKEFRSDARGKWILPQRTRNDKRRMECRRDIHRFGSPFLAIFESLIPPEEEKLKQKQLMALLEKLVCSEWPNAKLYVYGSCANSFGVSKSDIDICLAIEDQDIDKAEILLRLADILQSDNLQNVQALTRARVPIVKLMDPVTGISCDICINNVLAVVNTKLLRDYAEIDVRLRQLAFLVKHWAKTRGVNETYQGTLSSYAYVLMCIHFLQQRNPPILPCLQGMKPTYTVTVEHNECAFFDQVEKLRNFGAHNKENIAQLMWAFFRYWAYCHDYANTVVSVRTGDILSKHEKDWTRRVGNDRHLICIEDPFEVSHDLGRVVDKHSIRVLREEFERAAWIMQYDPNPCVSLFEPYVPPAP